MEHFLNAADDHNSSFFRPPSHDDDDYDEMDPQSSSPPPPPTAPSSLQLPPRLALIPSTSPIMADSKEEQPSAINDPPRSRLTFNEEANIKLQVLVSNFSDAQLDRYEIYRRSAFSKVAIKRLMHSITGAVPSSNVVIAMAGIAKVFVGEIVEEALQVQREQHNDETTTTMINQRNSDTRTPLEPKHLREAYRRVHNHQSYPKIKTWRSKRKSRF